MGREFHFPVEVAWDGGRRTTARVAGKAPLVVATPPEFHGSAPGLWSPEDAFVGAAATCLAVTIAGLAERDGLALRELAVHADGVVGRRPDGRFGFLRIDQTVDVAVEEGREDAATALVSRAEAGCLVSASLALPVETTVRVRRTEAAGLPG